MAQASAFFSPGLGDYLAASAANEIWVQPKSPFSTAGAGGGELFLRGTLDKINAQPQIAKVFAIVKMLPPQSMFASREEAGAYFAAIQNKVLEENN